MCGSLSILCKFWQLNGRVNGDLLQEGLCHTKVYCTQSPCPCSSPLLTPTSTGDTQTQFWLSLCGVSGSWCTQGLFEPFENFWHDFKHDFAPPTVLLGLSFFLGHEISFLGRIQHSPVYGCSAVSCNFRVLTGEAECMSFYSSLLGIPPKVGSQEVPGVTGKFVLGVQNKGGQRLTEFWKENTLVIASILFQQHQRRLYTWTSPDGQYQNQIDYILCSQRWRSSIQSAKSRPGDDCGKDHEFLIAK